MKEDLDIWPEEISPLMELEDALFEQHGLSVYVKRDDLLEPFGGNKGRKLKYAWHAFVKSGRRGLISMGGPFSNHLYAFASMCKHFGVPGKALVRGETNDLANPVLNHIRACGMELIALSRKEYAGRYREDFQKRILDQFPEYFMIPEGGASPEGIKGCYELGVEIIQQMGTWPDHLLVGAGTGTTAAGLARAAAPESEVIAISALRGKIIATAFGQNRDMLREAQQAALELNTAYHFGGFAKWDDELISFMRNFEKTHGILLDPLYTGKTAYALYDLVARERFERGSRIVLVHTGGNPGRLGFSYRFPGLLEDLS